MNSAERYTRRELVTGHEGGQDLDGWGILDRDDANVHVTTHTLHYGLGVFEGIRCYKCADERSAIFMLDAHVDRLFDSAHIARPAHPLHQGGDSRGLQRDRQKERLRRMLPAPPRVHGGEPTRALRERFQGAGGYHGMGVGRISRRRRPETASGPRSPPISAIMSTPA